MTYILDVLGKLEQQRVALMDAMRAAKDSGGSSVKVIQTYYGIRNSTRNAATTTAAKSDIMPVAGDDDRILGKIVELAVVPISTALAREMPGDSNHHVIRDIGDTLRQGFTALTAVIRLMVKVDPMEMSDDFFELANKGSDWFKGKKARCLYAYVLLCLRCSRRNMGRLISTSTVRYVKRGLCSEIRKATRRSTFAKGVYRTRNGFSRKC